MAHAPALSVCARVNARARCVRAGRLAAIGLLCGAALPGVALAQSNTLLNGTMVTPTPLNTLVAPAIAPDYFRDHNVGVLEQWHPDYEPAGMAIGSFVLHPQATFGTLLDSNVYATEADKKADVAAVLQLGASLKSDWSRHELALRVDTDQRRYASQLRRNQNGWDLQPSAKVELGRHVVLSFEGRAGRYYESPFGNDLSPDAQVLSNFFRSSVLTKVVYTGGRLRVTGAYDYSNYDFVMLRFPDGRTSSQTFRDRTINRESGQAEYALSPSVAVYVGGAFDQTDYKVAPTNGSILTSSGGNVLAGISFDISGVIRGLVGAGYSVRNSAEAKEYNVSEPSFQARIDLFPFEMTTVSVSGQRLIVDSGLGSVPIADTRLAVEVDQSLRENLVLRVSGAVVQQKFFGIDGKRDSRQFQAALRYQASRWLGFQGEMGYRYSEPTTTNLGSIFEGLLVGLSATVRR
jgi:hypothetical protein